MIEHVHYVVDQMVPTVSVVQQQEHAFRISRTKLV